MPQFPPGSSRMRQNLQQEGKKDTNFLISVRDFEYVNDTKYYHVLFHSRGSQSAVQWERQQSLHPAEQGQGYKAVPLME